MSQSANKDPFPFSPLVLRLLPWGGWLLMLGLALAISLLLRPGLDTLEERLGALGWTLNPGTVPEERIIIVSIDERSIAEVGPWPWPREQMARLVSAIDAAGAQLQLHDVIYSEAKPNDALLVNSLQTSGRAVLAQVPILQDGTRLGTPKVRTGVMTNPLPGIACDASSGAARLPRTDSFLAPHSGFAGIPKGHITSIIASDGSIRKIPALICVDGQAYPALALTALIQATSSTNWNASLRAGGSFFGPAQELRFDAFPGLTIPLDKNGDLRISFASKPSVFSAISAADVMNGSVDLSMLDNAWVLIGATAFSMDDIVPTPYSGATPGVELTARVLASVLDSAIPYTPRGSRWALWLLVLGFSGILYALAATRGRYAAYGLPLAVLLMPVTALALHVALLNSVNIWLGWVYPALYSALGASLLLLLELARVRMERSRVFGNLSSYLPSDVAREIAYELPNSSITAKRSNVTLLSADLRNFSAFGEARPPEESAAILHFFFIRATEIVEANGGRIHEFKGDGLLAVWDSHDATAAEKAVCAAQALQDALHHTLLPESAPAGLEPLGLGVGIEQGPALIGSIGPAHRRSHTLLGDTVTITLRIQEMTAELAQPILIGECAARQLSGHKLESQGSYLLSSLKIPHVLFALSPVATPRKVGNEEQPLLKVLTGGRQ